jgi:beta-barrel assembly-enhancing protease
MKHWGIFAIVVLSGIAAIVVAERRHVDVNPDPAPLVYLVADTEQELTRMPVQFTRMSDEEEVRIGNQLATGYGYEEKNNKTPQQIEIENYLNKVGAPLAARAHRKLPYRFHYIQDPYFINAFALPGGHVFVGGGLLALMDSEDELANVLGHEIEHIDHYHCAERVQQQQTLEKIPFGAVFSIPVSVFEAGYSKDQELEADREGTRLAVQTGYSPNGAIRMFETFERLYVERQHRSRSPQGELTDVAQQTLEGYFRSHPLPSERIRQIQALIASENWPVRAERELEIAYLYYTVQAQEAFEQHKYERAEQLASQSLKMRGDQLDALKILADAQFAQAKFSAAADSYRSFLQRNTTNNNVVHDFALSLAVTNRASAAREFKQWSITTGDYSSEVQIQQAGLSLLGGDSTPAKNILIDAAGNAGEYSLPVVKGKIGWWYYLAGDSDTASTLLEQAYQEQPEDRQIILHSAWALVEQKRYADALNRLKSIGYSQQNTFASAQFMIHAVVKWRTQQADGSIADFNSAITDAPQWENSKWVKALYSSFVYQTVEAIKAESTRRDKIRLASSHH